MKAIVFLIIGIGSLMGFVYTFQRNNNLVTVVGIYIDQTDSFNRAVTARDILAILNPNKYLWGEINVHLTTVTDNNYEEVSVVTLQSKNMLFSNPYSRKEEITVFGDSLTNALFQIRAKPIGRPNTILYEPIVREANRLARTKAERKYLIVESDLSEHSPLFSVYSPKDSLLLETNMDSVSRRLQNEWGLSDLSGLQVFLVYQPKGRLDNERFFLMSALLKKIFEQAGATVTIGANLIP